MSEYFIFHNMEIIKRNSDYVLRALIYLACQPHETIVDLTTLSKESDTPPLFLQKSLHKLVKSNVLSSTRGAKGGFALAKKAKDISVLEVIEIIQGPIAVNQCFDDGKKCKREMLCTLRSAIVGVQEGLIKNFGSITLQKLAREELKK